MNRTPILLPIIFAGLVLGGGAWAQSAGQGTTDVTIPPSVDAGVANGVVKPSGSPSVSNGVANGVVKTPDSPSVGNGIGNGVVKSTSVQGKTQ